MGLALMDHNVAFHRAVAHAHGAGGTGHELAHFFLHRFGQMTGQVAAIFHKKGRVFFQEFVIAV